MSRRPILVCGLTAVSARLAYAALIRRPPAGAKTWTRTNHRGEPVTLLEGPAVIAGALAGTLIAPGLSARRRAALAVAGAGAGAFGCYDDLAGSGARRGFRGHLGALARGEVTSGAVKLGGIGITGLAAAATLGGTAADQLINAGLVAGGANLLNLFDLRPGRAIKVTLAAALVGSGSPAGRACAAVPLGAALALLPEDLAERAMLGDAGANALGAMLGAAAAGAWPRPARAAALAAIVGLTAASEAVSFTKVIERTPPLRWLDMLGRRPVARPAASSAAASSAAAGPAGASGAEGAAGTTLAPAERGSPDRGSTPAAAAGPAAAAPL